MFQGILPSLIIAASFFGIFVLVLPEYDQIKASGKEIESRETVLKERQQALEKAFSLERQINQRQSDIDRINLLIPPRNQTDQVISSLQQITSQTGMQMLSINASPTTRRRGARNVLRVEVQLQGQYASFLNFLQLVEQNIRLYDVQEVSIGEATGGSPAQGLLSFNVKMDAYFIE